MHWLWLTAASAAPTLSTPNPVDGDPLTIAGSGAVGPVTLLAAPGSPTPGGPPDLGLGRLRLHDAEWLGTVTPDPLGDASLTVSLPPNAVGATWSVVAIDASGVSAPSLFTVQPGPQSGPDMDQDGLPDALEAQFYALVYDPDTDQDGLLDGDEVFVHHTNPSAADTDSDGLNDAAEVLGTTDPTQWDTDGGGASDSEELASGTDPNHPADDDRAGSDWDGDGLPDRIETLIGTRMWDPDGDLDGLLDGDEYFVYGTDPWLSDSDFGGESDGSEVAGGRDPLQAGDDL